MSNTLQLNHELITSRQNEINELSKGVHQISELFQDISILVSHQGEQIDNIETNINNSLNNVNKANNELIKAEKYEKKKKHTCFYIICIFSSILIFVAIITIITL